MNACGGFDVIDSYYLAHCELNFVLTGICIPERLKFDVCRDRPRLMLSMISTAASAFEGQSCSIRSRAKLRG